MASKESISNLSIPDVDCRNFGLKPAFGLGNQLHLWAGVKSRSDGKTAGAIRNARVHDVKWDTLMHNAHMRRVVSESRGTFVRMQKMQDQPTNIKNTIILNSSQAYRSILKAASAEIRRLMSDNGVLDELEEQLEMFEMLELLWSLCEIIFINSSPAGLILQNLLEWLRLHFSEGDNMATEVINTRNTLAPHEHPQYWKAIYCFLLQGRQTEVCGLLSLHPKISTKPFTIVEQLVRKMPVYSTHSGQSVGEFESRWKHWQSECLRYCEDGTLSSHEELLTICRILSGDDEVFRELLDLLGTWYCVMISRLLYQNPTVKPTDLQYHTEFCVEMFGGHIRLQPWDVIILAAIHLDIHEVIRECSASFNNWWLVAHLTDLLHHRGVIPPTVQNYGSTLREFLMLEYATSLLSSESLWQVGFEYLEYCTVFGTTYMSQYIERIPLDCDQKAQKILRICERYELNDQYRSISKVLGVRALHNNRVGSALSWGLKSKDSGFITQVTERILEEYERSGQLTALDLLDNLGQAMLLTSKLTFLGKYNEFHKLYTSGDFKEAANLLLSLLTSRTAPRKFWFNLLLDAIPLLEDSKIMFDADQTYELIHCLEEIDMPFRSGDSQQAKTPSEVIQLKRLKESLAKNLAKCFISSDFIVG